MNLDDKLKELQGKLSSIEAERSSILREIDNLKSERRRKKTVVPLLGRCVSDTPPTTPSEKIELFLNLFRCREEIFPKRWENKKKGTQGYAPVCGNEWIQPICQKPKIKCSDCHHQKFLPLDEDAVESHLKGGSTIGTYAIRQDDSTTFLACDFDESSWQDDAGIFKQAARELGIEVAIERSRSGNGAHAWIFFELPIPARIARSLGTLILARCAETSAKLSLDSYDRFFPSQDYLPKGGFGNLVALPLQKIPREQGNSCFLTDEFRVHQDQWAYLSTVRRFSFDEVRKILDEYLPHIQPSSKPGSFDDISWITDQSILEHAARDTSDEISLAGIQIEITFGSMLVIPLENLPGAIVARLRKTASFPNPEFYKLQRMRMQTYPHRRFIFSGEIREDDIVLPRGVVDEVVRILTLVGAKVVIRDERIAKRKVKAEFTGELSPAQKEAIKICKKSDYGILVAPPGAGKTVMACALIAERKVSTLILVHRQQILDQWKERITQFLGIPPKEIGNLSGTKKKMTGRLDLAMLQSLTRIEDFSEMTQSYSQIIIDECHHIPATSFEAILKQLPARYVLGLTATPYRKDGLEKILFQQCGPVRHQIKSIDGGVLAKSVQILETGFKTPEEIGFKPPYHLLIQALTSDPLRNAKIAKATVGAMEKGASPLLLSDRKEHLDMLSIAIKSDFETRFPEKTIEIIRLDGGLSNKHRRIAIERATLLLESAQPFLLMSTSSLIGEGFDLPALDTLILATPLSFEGRMIQYAGRLHRLVEGKTTAHIIDFVDSYSAMFVKMYKNRLKAYQKMGYVIQRPTSLFGTFSSWLPADQKEGQNGDSVAIPNSK